MILHVDMDAFYASVEELDNPELVGRPVVVGGTPEGRGVVAAANYAARQFGVHSAMPAARARRLCPHAVFIRSRMHRYAEVSHALRELFARYTPLIEPLSLDEAFLDVASSVRLFGDAESIARRIKDEIRAELGLVASVGVAPNKFLAKLASDLDKPDGLVVVPPDDVEAFLDPLPVSRLWGVGKVASRDLANIGIRTIGELRASPEDLLEGRLGRWAGHLKQLASGIDERRVIPEREAKSISHETTFAEDIDQIDVLRSWLLELGEQVATRLRRQGLRARTVFIKVRYEDFKTVSRTETLDAPTELTRVLFQSAARLLDAELGARPRPVRLLGMGVSGITADRLEQGELFEQTSLEQQRRIDTVVDAVKSRFGSRALRRGGGARPKGDHRLD
ncbi:MAG: DNA polymerase IV [Gammaproteobacteria bacterium]|nr:DNA polymerase IV [Gammaproteobacteria bacterium]